MWDEEADCMHFPYVSPLPNFCKFSSFTDYILFCYQLGFFWLKVGKKTKSSWFEQWKGNFLAHKNKIRGRSCIRQLNFRAWYKKDSILAQLSSIYKVHPWILFGDLRYSSFSFMFSHQTSRKESTCYGLDVDCPPQGTCVMMLRWWNILEAGPSRRYWVMVAPSSSMN
jgi:hypothetical protein